MAKEIVEIDQFIENILKPYYMGFNGSDLEMGARQINGPTLFITDKYVDAMKGKLTVQEILNKSRSSPGDDVCNSEVVAFCRQLDSAMLKSPTIQEFIIRDVRKDGDLSCGTNTPIFAPSGQCIGFQFIYQPLSAKLLITTELLNRQISRYATKTIALNNLHPIELTDFEERILSFLLLGYTQLEIANFFKCSRSYIAKIIAENLCRKFSVVGSSAKLLVERALFLGYANFIPRSLIIGG